MNIETFKTEVVTSTDLDLMILHETLMTARIAAVHMQGTWAMLADMVDASRIEVNKRGLRAKATEWAGDAPYEAAFTRAVNAIATSHPPLSVEERLEGDFE